MDGEALLPEEFGFGLGLGFGFCLDGCGTGGFGNLCSQYLSFYK